MAMINMKSKPETEEMPGQIEGDEPQYPYGLCLHLEKDQLEALGITALPTVGSKMTINASVYVKSVSAYNTQSGEQDMSMSLQITDMEITPAKGEATNDQRASLLYGNSSNAGSSTSEPMAGY
jgi:hypothetical protein